MDCLFACFLTPENVYKADEHYYSLDCYSLFWQVWLLWNKLLKLITMQLKASLLKSYLITNYMLVLPTVIQYTCIVLYYFLLILLMHTIHICINSTSSPDNLHIQLLQEDSHSSHTSIQNYPQLEISAFLLLDWSISFLCSTIHY